MSTAGEHTGIETPVLDIRTYKLTPKAGKAFDRIVREDTLPMLERAGIRVVAYGPSADDDDTYYLIRRFDSAVEREEQLDSFYGSDEWRRNYRKQVAELVEAYHVAVVQLTRAVRAALWSAAAAATELPLDLTGDEQRPGSDERSSRG